MALYVYEFLYRGRSPDEAGATPAWHLILGQSGTDGFGAPLPNGPVMTMQQAAGEGHDLPAIIAEINAAALAEVDRLNAQVADLRTRLQEGQQT